MKDQIVLISNFLRNEGMLVSIRSTLLAHQVLDMMGDSMNYDELYHSLKTIYVKDLDEIDMFDRAFNKFFKKIEAKPKKQDKKETKIENIDSESTKKDFVPNPDLDELQELYDQMIEDRSNSKTKENQIVNGSMVLLDSYDPKVFELCKRLSRKIANKRSKRRKKNNSHDIDMPRTIRTNIKNGGHCIKLIHQKPPMRKNKHIFLCDVSGSCEWTTSFFLLLLYGCARSFQKIKIYDFDNKLTDVTDLMTYEKFNNIGQVNIAQKTKGISCFGQSDMVASFEQFLKEAELNHRTDVIILSDCRDWKGERKNGVLKSASLVKEMVKRSRQVIILNPEKKIRWNNATSCVEDYEKAGAKIYETSSLNKFEEVISEL